MKLSRGRVLWLATLVEGGLFSLACVLARLLERPLALGWPPSGRSLLLGVMATFPMLGLLWFAVRARSGPLRTLTASVREMVGSTFAASRTLDLLLVSLLAGLGEEALFRGVLQAGLAPFLGPWAALASASLAFGLAHAASFTYAAIATLTGLYLGALLLYSGDLVAPIVAHALYDFIGLCWLLRAARRGSR